MFLAQVFLSLYHVNMYYVCGMPHGLSKRKRQTQIAFFPCLDLIYSDFKPSAILFSDLLVRGKVWELKSQYIA